MKTIDYIRVTIDSGESRTLELKKSIDKLIKMVKHYIAELNNWRENTPIATINCKIIYGLIYTKPHEIYWIEEIKPYSLNLYQYIF